MSYIQSNGMFTLSEGLTPEILQQLRKDLRPVGREIDPGIVCESNPKGVPVPKGAEAPSTLPLRKGRVQVLASANKQPDNNVPTKPRTKSGRPLPPIPGKKITPLQLDPRPEVLPIVSNTDRPLPPTPVSNADRPLPPTPVSNADRPLPPIPVNQEPPPLLKQGSQSTVESKEEIIAIEQQEIISEDVETSESTPAVIEEKEASQVRAAKESRFKRAAKVVWRAVKKFFVMIGRFFKRLFTGFKTLKKVQVGNKVIYDASKSKVNCTVSSNAKEDQAGAEGNPQVSAIPPAPPLPSQKNETNAKSVKHPTVIVENKQTETFDTKKKIDEKIASQAPSCFQLMVEGIQGQRNHLNEEEEEDQSVIQLTFRNQKQVETIVRLDPLRADYSSVTRKPIPTNNDTSALLKTMQGVIDAKPEVFEKEDPEDVVDDDNDLEGWE